MSTLRRSWLRLAAVTLVVGVGLAQLGATSSKVDAVDLGQLCDTCTYAYGYAVNGSGHVAGLATNSDGQVRAFFWQERKPVRRLPWDPAPVGEMTDLGTLPGMTSSMAFALNDRDQVVGSSSAGVGADWVSRAFVWERGRLKALGALPGFGNSGAYDINAQGQIVGGMWGPPNDYSQAVVWQRGVASRLPALPGGTSTWATALNVSGDIVGASDNRPVIWRRGVPTDLGTPPGYEIAVPNDINIRGQVVGQAVAPGEYTKPHCLLWNDGVVIEIGMPSGYDYCNPWSINDLGEVSGYLANSEAETAFIWQSGVMTDLNAYVPPNSGWRLDFAMGISGGAIVGRGGNVNGRFRAYKLQIR